MLRFFIGYWILKTGLNFYSGPTFFYIGPHFLTLWVLFNYNNTSRESVVGSRETTALPESIFQNIYYCFNFERSEKSCISFYPPITCHPDGGGTLYFKQLLAVSCSVLGEQSVLREGVGCLVSDVREQPLLTSRESGVSSRESEASDNTPPDRNSLIRVYLCHPWRCIFCAL